MQINKDIISKFNPCDNRFNNYLNNYGDQNFDIQEFLNLENITYSDKVWVVTRLFTKEQNIKWSILCAESVLHIFETQYPNDNRPRKALEAAQAYLNDPSEENRNATYAAYYAAANAAYATIAANAAYAAATNAAYAAANAVYAAANAAYATIAANAAYATIAANAARAEKEQKKINLLLMLECL